MNISLKVKLSILLILAAVIPIAIIYYFSKQTQETTSDRLTEVVTDDTNEKLIRIADNVYKMLEINDKKVKQLIEAELNVTRDRIAERGGISVSSRQYSWDAINQYTKEVTSTRLPALGLGGTPMPQVFDFSRPLPIIDDMYKSRWAAPLRFSRG
jgi:hypothetical protein